MAERKQRELAVGHSDGVVSDTSAGFVGSELMKGYYHVHPIWKAVQVAKGKNCYNLDSVFSQVPRGQRSNGRVRKANAKPLQDAGSCEVSSVDESISVCHFAHPRKPRSMRSKRKAGSSDSEVICEGSICYARQSRRLQRSTKVIQKWGKLDTEKFEYYMENVWRRFTEEKRNVFAYLDSLWFSLYTREPLKAKVLSWIKKKDIFSKKYVFVPIVQWGHWFLLIFCHFGESPQSKTKGRCMLLLDSLQQANSQQLEPGIRRFVYDIFKIEERPEEKDLINSLGWMVRFQVPQQKNGEECGFFVLYYIHLFLESAPDNFSFSVGYPHFMKEDWFTPDEVECFVESLGPMNKHSECSD